MFPWNGSGPVICPACRRLVQLLTLGSLTFCRPEEQLRMSHHLAHYQGEYDRCGGGTRCFRSGGVRRVGRRRAPRDAYRRADGGSMCQF